MGGAYIHVIIVGGAYNIGSNPITESGRIFLFKYHICNVLVYFNYCVWMHSVSLLGVFS